MSDEIIPPPADTRRIIKSPWKAKLRIGLSIAVTILIITFFVLNPQPTTLHLVFLEIQLPAGILYFLILLVGIILGFLARPLIRKKRKA